MKPKPGAGSSGDAMARVFFLTQNLLGRTNCDDDVDVEVTKLRNQIISTGTF